MRRLRRYGVAMLCVLVTLAWSHLASSENRTLTWQPPTEYEDDTPIGPGELETYTLICGGLNVQFPGDTTSGVYDFPPGSYDCVLTVTATNGETSMPSNQVSFTIAQPPPPAPKAPTNLTVM